MCIYHEESFGPLASIVIVPNAEEALRVANYTECGLSSAVFSRDASQAMKLAERLETGICHINGAIAAIERRLARLVPQSRFVL
jgi:acyl-CoA reductase-like NAD-dependent aldehyde dehydrogenase